MLYAAGIDCWVAGAVAAQFHLEQRRRKPPVSAQEALILVAGPDLARARRLIPVDPAGIRIETAARELPPPILSREDLPVLGLEEVLPLLLDSFRLGERILLRELDEARLISAALEERFTSIQRDRLEMARRMELFMDPD
jgi:hypothetical protein